MSLIAMAFLWTGSQIPLYIFGTSPLLTVYHFRIIGADFTTQGAFRRSFTGATKVTVDTQHIKD